jgi:hypothetical protein
MFRRVRTFIASVTATVCVVLLAGEPAHAQVPTPAEKLVTVDGVRDSFTRAGYQVGGAENWDWTSPPVTTFQVEDVATGRLLLVLVYGSATAADAARLESSTHGQALAGGNVIGTAGPHLVVGYGPSTWNQNAAMVQTSRVEFAHAYQVQNEFDCGITTQTDGAHPSNTNVDVDFQIALLNGIANQR